jgi:hypothetical protein
MAKHQKKVTNDGGRDFFYIVEVIELDRFFKTVLALFIKPIVFFQGLLDFCL